MSGHREPRRRDWKERDQSPDKEQVTPALVDRTGQRVHPVGDVDTSATLAIAAARKMDERDSIEAMRVGPRQ